MPSRTEINRDAVLLPRIAPAGALVVMSRCSTSPVVFRVPEHSLVLGIDYSSNRIRRNPSL